MRASTLQSAVLWLSTALLAAGSSVSTTSQWDVASGDFHTHLISTDTGFELHVHDKATHSIVDTRKGKVVATMLVGGRSETVPLTFKQAGILSGSRVLEGDWTMLFRFDVPGMKPAQVRYSSKMKPGNQDAATGAASRAGDKGANDHSQHAHGK
jgi:hypothetical protein